MESLSRLDTFHGNECLVETLVRFGVRFLVVGGVGVRFYDSEREADDLDLLVEPTVENARRLVDALASLDRRPVQLDIIERLVHPRGGFGQIILKDRRFYADVLSEEGVDFVTAWTAAPDAVIGSAPVRVAPAALLLTRCEQMNTSKHASDAERLRRVIQARGG